MCAHATSSRSSCATRTSAPAPSGTSCRRAPAFSIGWARIPYMFVHLDVSFDFLDTLRDYVQTTGDVAFAQRALGRRSAPRTTTVARRCRRGARCRDIPAGQQGRDEQDPQRDELSLSLAWITASESFATLARLTGHADARGRRERSQRARSRRDSADLLRCAARHVGERPSSFRRAGRGPHRRPDRAAAPRAARRTGAARPPRPPGVAVVSNAVGNSQHA